MDLTDRIIKLLTTIHKQGGKFRFNLEDLEMAHLVGPNEDEIMENVKLALYKDHGLLMFTLMPSEYSVSNKEEIEAEGGIVIKADEIEKASEVLGSTKDVAEYVQSKMRGGKKKH